MSYLALMGVQSPISSGRPKRDGSPQSGQGVWPPARSSNACCAVTNGPSRCSSWKNTCHRACRSRRIENRPTLVLKAYATIGFSTALSGGVGLFLAGQAYHRQSATFPMPAARISRARLTRRASPTRAAGTFELASPITPGLALGLGSPGRFSLFIHRSALFGRPVGLRGTT